MNTFDIKELYQKIYGYVAEPYPALAEIKDQLALKAPTGIINTLINQYRTNALGVKMILPLTLEIPGELTWEVPVEPMISLGRSHHIVRSTPLNSRRGGTIKERWNSDDYTLSVQGFLIDFSKQSYPSQEVEKLIRIMEAKQSIVAKSPLLSLFGIKQIAVEKYSLPHTQDLYTQAYQFEALSDELHDALLLENG